MIPLYNQVEFEKAKSLEKLPLQCKYCKNTFTAEKRYIQHILKSRTYALKFCSQKCWGLSQRKRQNVKCDNCNKTFIKKECEIEKYKKNFCNRSCACTYSNLHKTSGYKRSKLEKWLEEQLIVLYPDLKFHFNRKDTINSELDIYIPSLKLAFELNGIFHYEPIYGKDKLNQIQNNDKRKFQACLKENIGLCIIDTSQQKYFKPKSSQKYLDIITNIINENLKE